MKHQVIKAQGKTNLKRIGLFDSGVGGLTVLRSLSRAGAGQGIEFVYLGDTARCPYGNRPHSEIASFVEEIVGWLASFHLDAVVMACNTSAASARDTAVKTAAKLSPRLAVYDLIEPTAQLLAGGSARSIGVIATATTANSRAFSQAFKRHKFHGTVKEIGCPKLVPLIESGRLGQADCEAELAQALTEYLQTLAHGFVGDSAPMDALILGCTHYPFLAARIEKLVQTSLAPLFPHGLQLIDPSQALAQELFGKVGEPGAAVQLAARLYCTGPAFEFAETASLCLGEDLGAVMQISLTELADAYVSVLTAAAEVVSPNSFA